MPLVAFAQEIVQDIAPIAQLGAEVFQEFVNLALNSIHGEKVAPKVYQKAGSTLNIEPESLQKAVVALAASLLEAAKKNANEKEFVASSYDLTLSSENQAILIKTYTDNVKQLRNALNLASLQLPTYSRLDWRLDCEIATRALRNIAEPSYTMELELKHVPVGSEGQSSTASVATQGQSQTQTQTKTHHLQMDYLTLQHLVDELTKATQESRTVHARRILRYVK